MKSLIVLISLMVGASALGRQLSSGDRANNKKIEQCSKKLGSFLKDVPFDRNGYFRGRNKLGQCFIIYPQLKNKSRFMLTLNSKENRKYVASVEVSSRYEESQTGITSTINQCEKSNSKIVIKSVYRMPRSWTFMSDGTIKKSLSLFDYRENQKIELFKDSRQRLVKALVTTGQAGTLSCLFY